MKHTPTPWRIRDLNDDFGKNAPQIATMADPDGFGKPIASVCHLSESEREANAAYIIQCVNSHSALVAALEHIATGGENWKDCARVARAALKLARGE